MSRFLAAMLFLTAATSLSWGEPVYTVNLGGVVDYNSWVYLSLTSSSSTETQHYSYTVQGSTPLYSFASAGPGVLAAEAVAGGPVDGLSAVQLQADGIAKIQESITASNGQTDGFMRMYFAVHTIPPDTGLLLGTGSGSNAEIDLLLYPTNDPSNPLASGSYDLFNGPNGPTFTSFETPTRPYLDIPIQANGTALFEVTLYVRATCQLSVQICAANADWSHTVLFGGAAVYDANGTPEPTVLALGESGFNYSAPFASESPEPSTVSLLLVGAAAILSRGRRRQPR